MSRGLEVDEIELRRVQMPLVSPFRTSFGVTTVREALLVRVRTPEADGWGECVADAEPRYSSEHLAGAEQVISDFLVPALSGLAEVTVAAALEAWSVFDGHLMAKAALEAALLDADLRARGRSLGEELGAVRTEVDCGVSVGIMDSIPELLDQVGGYLSAGYRRIKLKIQPGWDVEPVRAVREKYGDIPLQVDANTAYRRFDTSHLARLDDFDLLLIEQPLPERDLLGHQHLAGALRTPICLDESITSAADAAQAIALGACSVVNIKAGRVGGLLEAKRIHDVCQAHGVPVWCGGMLESGVGRAANLALAALPGFTLPGDTSASERYYTRDLTTPFVMVDGRLSVPSGPGIGVSPDPDVLTEHTTHVVHLEGPR